MNEDKNERVRKKERERQRGGRGREKMLAYANNCLRRALIYR